jgi:hypothetical protein
MMNHKNINYGFNLKKFLLIISAILIVGYGFFNAREFILGPSIEIMNKNEFREVGKNIVTIKGIAKNTVYLTLNEKPVYLDRDGNFEEKLLLSPGFNTIQMYGRDRFKKETLEELKIYYKENIN